jgi:signal peptidase I
MNRRVITVGIAAVLGICVLAYLIAGLAFGSFRLSATIMPTDAMAPTCHHGDIVVVAHGAYRHAEPQRGDVVTFRWRHGLVIRRIVGMPADRIRMTGGRLVLNGLEQPSIRAIGREYIETLRGSPRHGVLLGSPYGPAANTAVYFVPDGAYFVMSDNRSDGDDSRGNIGFVPRNAITGKVVARL